MDDYVEHNRKASRAKKSLILGIASLFFPLPWLFLLPMEHWGYHQLGILLSFGLLFGLICGSAGVYSGFLALDNSSRYRRFATTAIVCGFIGAIGGFFQVIYMASGIFYLHYYAI